LLIAILLPALRSARDAARSALCLGNQQQIGVALHSYAIDHNMDFPKPVDWEIFNFGNHTDFYTWGGRLFYKYQLVSDSRVFHCPSSDLPDGLSSRWPSDATEPVSGSFRWAPRKSYGLRARLFHNAGTHINLARVFDPSDYIVTTETTHPTHFTVPRANGAQFYLFDQWHSFYLLHVSGANTAFADGSVRVLTRVQVEDLYQRDQTLGPWINNRVFIDPDGSVSGF